MIQVTQLILEVLAHRDQNCQGISIVSREEAGGSEIAWRSYMCARPWSLVDVAICFKQIGRLDQRKDLIFYVQYI